MTRQTVDELLAIHPDRDVRIDSLGEFWGEWDSGRLGQMMSNLIGNAIQQRLLLAAPKAGRDVKSLHWAFFLRSTGMPSLEFELEQFAVANRHIQEAEETIERMRLTIAEEQRDGVDTVEADRSLQVVLDSLGAFVEHRDLIARMIDDIRSGRIPST